MKFGYHHNCVANVFLLEYAKKRKRPKVKSAINKRVRELLETNDSREREKDMHWLLIYQVWKKKELEENKQGFLAELKGKNFEFFSMPTKTEDGVIGGAFQELPQQLEAAKA